MPELQGVRVAILATDFFEESELVQPKQALEEAGAKKVVIAPKSGKIQAVRHIDKTIQIPVDLTLDKVEPEDFDAVHLPGGAMNADALRIEKQAQEFVRAIDRVGKPLAVICHGPWLLTSAGLVRGRISRVITLFRTIYGTPVPTGWTQRLYAIATGSAAASLTTFQHSIAN